MTNTQFSKFHTTVYRMLRRVAKKAHLLTQRQKQLIIDTANRMDRYVALNKKKLKTKRG